MSSRYSMILKAICILAIGYIIVLPKCLCQLESSENGFQIDNDIVRLVKSPRDVLGATPGSRVQFDCLAYPTGNNMSIARDQPLMVAWMKDDKKISINRGGRSDDDDDDSHYFTTQKSSSILVVYPVTWQHEGDYRCAIFHPKFGVVLSRRARLTLREMPTFITTAKNTSVIAGTNIKLSCSATGYPKPAIKWYRNDKPISLDDAKFRDRYYVLSTGDLKITNFDVNADQGFYFCSAVNDVGEILSPKALITTSSTHGSSHVALPSTMNPISLNFITSSSIGQTVYMECISDDFSVSRSKFTAGNSNYTVTWSRNDGIPLKKGARIFAQDLEIPNVDENDKAVHICRIEIENSGVFYQSEHDLDVLHSPIFLTTPKTLVKHRNGDANFFCAVEGNPPPIIRWYKDGEPMKIQGRLKTIPYPGEVERTDFSMANKVSYQRNLRISSPQFDKDVAIYQCFAENSEGEMTAAAPLIMYPYSSDDMKRAPSSLRAFVAQDERKIKLTWSAPQALPAVYLVHFYATNGSTASTHDYENTEPAPPHDHCSANGTCVASCCSITPLRPFTFYTFWISGIDLDGRTSPPTESVVIRTFEATAPIIVHPLTAMPCRSNKNLSRSSSSCVHLIWKRPDESSIPGVISEYRIEYVEDSRPNIFNDIFVKPTIDDYEIRNLKPGVSYLFRVIPKTLAGYPDAENLNVRGRSFPFLHYKTPSVESRSSPAPFFVSDISLDNVGQSKSPAYRVVVNAIAKSDAFLENCRIRFGTLDSTFIENEITLDIDWSFNDDRSLIVGRSSSLLEDLPTVFHQTTVECDSNGDSVPEFSFARVLHSSTFSHINQSTFPVVSNQFLATVSDLQCHLLAEDPTVNFSVVLNWRIGEISVAGYDLRFWINDEPYREILIKNATENRLILNDLSPNNLKIKFAMRSIFPPDDRLSWFSDEKVCHFPPDMKNFTIKMPNKIDVTILNRTTVNLTFVEPQYSNLIITEHIIKREHLLYKVRYGKNEHFDEVYLPNVEQKSRDHVTLILGNLEPASSYRLNIAAPDKLGHWGPFSHDCFFQTPFFENGTTFQCYLIGQPSMEESNSYRLIIGLCIIFACCLLFICLLVYRRRSNICSRRNGTTTDTNSKFCLLNLLSCFRDTNNNIKDGHLEKKKRFWSSGDRRSSSMSRRREKDVVEIAPVKYGNGTLAEIDVGNGVDMNKPLLENGTLTSVVVTGVRGFYPMQNGSTIVDQSSVLTSEM